MAKNRNNKALAKSAIEIKSLETKKEVADKALLAAEKLLVSIKHKHNDAKKLFKRARKAAKKAKKMLRAAQEDAKEKTKPVQRKSASRRATVKKVRKPVKVKSGIQSTTEPVKLSDALLIPPSGSSESQTVN